MHDRVARTRVSRQPSSTEDAVEHGELEAKLEIGETIPRGEFGPCDP